MSPLLRFQLVQIAEKVSNEETLLPDEVDVVVQNLPELMDTFAALEVQAKAARQLLGTLANPKTRIFRGEEGGWVRAQIGEGMAVTLIRANPPEHK